MNSTNLPALAALFLGVCGVVGTASIPRDGTAGIQMSDSGARAIFGWGCGTEKVSATTYCMTGAPLVDCPGWAFCDGSTCFTDCSPVSGAGYGAATPSFGYFNNSSCASASSTYAIRNCTYLRCLCTGTVLNPAVSCPGTVFTWIGCQ